MDIPVSYDFKEAVFEIRGGRSVYIENYRKILEYDSEHVALLTKAGPIHIYGHCLSIAYYTPEDMKIEGTISNICFGDGQEVR